MTTGIFATLLRPPNFTTRVLGAVKPSLSDDDEEEEEEEYDDDDDIDVTAACLAAVYILCGKLFDFCLRFFLFFIHACTPQSPQRRVQKKEREERRISFPHSYSSVYIIDNT